MLQQDSDALATGSRDHLPPDRFLHNQANRPACIAFRRIAADHRDDALVFGCAEQGNRTRALLIVKPAVQTSFLVAVRDHPHGLRRELAYKASGLRRSLTIGQVQKNEGAQYNPNRLHSAGQQSFQRLPVLLCHRDTQGSSRHRPRVTPKHSLWQMFYTNCFKRSET